MAEFENDGSVEGGKARHADEAYVKAQERVSRLTESRLDPQPRTAADEKQRKERILRRG